MKTELIPWDEFEIAVVIPCYRVEREIGGVLQSLPAFVRHIIVVDDASPDETARQVSEFARRDARVLLLRHAKNLGVGGAMVTGFKKALEMGAEIIVKMDGDGQMSADYLPRLLTPLANRQADYVKGNRFREFRALEQMPWRRRIGNTGVKFCEQSGDWLLECI
ncbi:MAG: hypothetical protein OHK0031_13140 [Anaerolineales bacterium]